MRFIREIRDPIHRYVKLTALENRIVDSPHFQRLAQVSQMHSAHLVYPGATYARKVHSFGAMHIAHRIICHLLAQHDTEFENRPHPLLYVDQPVRRDWGLSPLQLREGLRAHGIEFTDQEVDLIPLYVVQAIRLAALLHDIGHAPLSHLYELASKGGKDGKERYNHERKGVKIIREALTASPGGGEAAYLEQQDAEFVAAIIENSLRSTHLTFLHDIISGPLDADKMDYLLRDSHYTGTTEYGTIDLDRILDTLVVVNGRLCYASNGLDALVQALNAMFFMYNNVYLHRTVRAFDVAALEGLKEISAFLRGYEESDPPTLPDGTAARAFPDLDDASFLATVEAAAGAERAAGRPHGPYNRAFAALRALRRREKTFRAVVDSRLAIPLSASAAYEDIIKRTTDQLEGIKREIIRVARVKEDDLRLDLEKNIRPIGLGMDDLTLFLTTELIYDVPQRKVVRFTEFHPHYKTLTRIVVPVRLYVRVGAELPERTRTALLDKVHDALRSEQERLGHLAL